MGVILNGILSGVSGRVAGVVGARWKDKQYLRRYAMPANPNTTLQQAQRNKMSYAVKWFKPLVGPVFNKYVDKFEKSMSGFNRIIKQNVALFVADHVETTMKVVLGKLWGPAGITGTSTSNILHLSWTPTSLGNNGAATDKVYAAVVNTTTGLWFFPPAEVARSAGSMTLDCTGAQDATFLTCFVWTAKYGTTSPTLLEMVSDSMAINVTHHV